MVYTTKLCWKNLTPPTDIVMLSKPPVLSQLCRQKRAAISIADNVQRRGITMLAELLLLAYTVCLH